MSKPSAKPAAASKTAPPAPSKSTRAAPAKTTASASTVSRREAPETKKTAVAAVTDVAAAARKTPVRAPAQASTKTSAPSPAAAKPPPQPTVAKPIAKTAIKPLAVAAIAQPTPPTSGAVKGTPLKTTAAQATAAATAIATPVYATPVHAPPAPTPAPAPSTHRSSKAAAARAQPAPTSPASTRLSGATAAAAKAAATLASGTVNRFTDRFAPAPKPATPSLGETSDIPRPHPKADPKLANAWKTKPGRELSEAELMAMPDAEYMNDKQLDFFRNRLRQQRDDLLSNAGETTEHLREDTSIVPDPADRATIEEEQALELRTRDRERKLLKKISQSITRLDSGEYGFCDETGEPIGLPRLLARPTATLSLEAQQRRELKQKMFGD